MREFDEDEINSKQEIYTDINSVINQEDHYLEILSDKIKLIAPNVIVVEKDISYKMIEVLRNRKIAAISNLNIDKMRKLARLTKTIIVPSANVIDKNLQLGKCQMFKVENPINQNVFGGS